MTAFRYSDYSDILLMMPLLILGLGVVLFAVYWMATKIFKD